MNETLENGEKPNFGHDFGLFSPNFGPNFFLSVLTVPRYHPMQCKRKLSNQT